MPPSVAIAFSNSSDHGWPKLRRTQLRYWRPAFVEQKGALLPFQSTRPRGARRRTPTSADTARGFNPRAREGRDSRSSSPTRNPLVSIHVPARGATGVRRVGDRLGARVSIHAPARGATTRSNSERMPSSAFQSARPRGARQDPRRQPRQPDDVSIHAPARGATRCLRTIPVTAGCFNPRAREGRDLSGSAVDDCFNPRAREGRD